MITTGPAGETSGCQNLVTRLELRRERPNRATLSMASRGSGERKATMRTINNKSCDFIVCVLYSQMDKRHLQPARSGKVMCYGFPASLRLRRMAGSLLISSSRAFASLITGVWKPSVNQP